MKVIIFTVCFCLFALVLAQAIQAQGQIASSSASATGGGGSRQQDGLNGPVRRVRVETVNLLLKEGNTVEGPRVVREKTTYDQKGQKIESVAYPAEGSAVVGKQQYLYDAKGNIIEMVLRRDDGSILNKEKYDYQFDEFGNWKKMTASIVVYENGNVGYEPFEITYRTITYYYGQQALKVITAPTVTPVSKTSTTATASGRAKITKPTSDVHVSVAATGIATSDVKKTSNAAEAIVVKPEKSEPSITAPPAVTPKVDAPKLPVMRMSEEALRKAAIDLPQPQYPEAAMFTGAEGNVEVQILVDEKGEVMNAKAVSGNPLFSEVAAAAARKAKFSRVNLSPEPARIYGVINYTFTLPGHQSAASPAANATSSELQTSLSNQGISDLKILQPGDSSDANPRPATDSLAPAASFYAKGSAFLASGRNSEAAEALRQAIQHDPNDAAAYAKLGVAYAALHQYQEAVVVLKMAIRIKPEIVDAEAYYQLSNAYTALGKFSQALEAIKQAMYIKRAEQANPEVAGTLRSPSLADLHYSTGLAYYNLRRYSGAIEELKQVVALNPKLAQAYYGLALSYIAIGDRKSAEKQQEAVESLDPVFAAKIAKLLSSRPSTQQGFGFVFKTKP
jgi:TonB family protein